MYRVPSHLQRRNKERTKLNLIPILDSVFIFIFFLLVSSNFINLKEVSSVVPILSDSAPEKNEEPLALTLVIGKETIKLTTGLNSKSVGEFKIDEISELQKALSEIKANHETEKTIIFEPSENVDYEKIITLMDAVKQDSSKNELFGNIIFGNVME